MVIGAGPAGLMAAEEMARAGPRVVVCAAMPTPGRKFLMAGTSGVNPTKEEPLARFVVALQAPPPEPMFGGCGRARVVGRVRVESVQGRAMRTRSSGSAGKVPVTVTWRPVRVSVATY